MPVLRPLATLPPIVAFDALGFVSAQSVRERAAELWVQHEVAADGVVDVALVGVDEMVGACRRRDDSPDGNFARVHGVHMADEPVALGGREERGQDDPPVAGIFLPLRCGESRTLRHIRAQEVRLPLFGAGHFS